MKIVLSILVLMGTVLACSKKIEPLKKVDYLLQYEVITSDGKPWFGEYNDSTGKRVQTNFTLPNGWKYTFRLQSFPFDMFVSATTDCGCAGSATAPDVTINFYSNGELFKTEKNTWAKGVTSLVFDIR